MKALNYVKFVLISTLMMGICIIILLFNIKKTESISGAGIIVPTKYINIYAPTSGKILNIRKSFGDIVKRGELLIEMASDDLEQAILENDIQINNIITQIKAKEIELENINIQKTELERKKTVTKLDLENLQIDIKNIDFLLKSGEKTKYDLLKAEVEEIKKKLELENLINNDKYEKRIELIKKEVENLVKQEAYLRKKKEIQIRELENCKIISEYDNVSIITPQIEDFRGATVSKGTLICSIADLSKLKMIVSLKESDIGKVKIGQKVLIFIESIPYEKFTTLDGKVIKLYPQSKAENYTTHDKVDIELIGFSKKIRSERMKEVNLKSGLKANAKIILKDEQTIIMYLWQKIFE